MSVPLWVLLTAAGLAMWVAWALMLAAGNAQAPYALATGAAVLLVALWDYAEGGRDG